MRHGLRWDFAELYASNNTAWHCERCHGSFLGVASPATMFGMMKLSRRVFEAGHHSHHWHRISLSFLVEKGWPSGPVRASDDQGEDLWLGISSSDSLGLLVS